jgi:thiol-disulfide isomerase/thioredoxin
MHCRIAILLCAFVGTSAAVSLADEPAPSKRELSSDEKELIELVTDMRADRDQWFEEMDKIKDEKIQNQFYLEKTSSDPFVTRFIAFEKKHRGKRPGLLAIRQLWRMTGSTAESTGAGHDGAIHVLDVLGNYGGFDELPEILRYVDRCPRAQVETSLRQLIAAEHTSENNRIYAKLTLARWNLYQRLLRDVIPKVQAKAAANEITLPQSTLEYDAKLLAMCVPQERIWDLEREALAILKDLRETAGNSKQYFIAASDEKYIAIYADRDKPGTLVKDLADGILFDEVHLRRGQPAPELTVKLLDGAEFSLAAQQGKTVIIQFSFTGCGPCEAMYPQLKELAEQFPDKVEILTIMRDEKDEDAKAAIASGKITWKLCIDGVPGPITTKWAVRGFPTVFVFGPDGKAASNDDIADPELRKKIREVH